MDPLPLEDEFVGDDTLMNEFLSNEVSMFSQQAIEDFMIKAFGNRKVIQTEDITISGIDDLVLLILGTVRAEFGEMFFTIEKIGESTRNGNYIMPEYKFLRKGKSQ
jgi:hypothetical protein